MNKLSTETKLFIILFKLVQLVIMCVSFNLGKTPIAGCLADRSIHEKEGNLQHHSAPVTGSIEV